MRNRIFVCDKGEEATLAHGTDVGEPLVEVAIGESGEVHLVNLAYGFIVVEIGVPLDKNMIKLCAEQTWSSDFKQPGYFIGNKSEKSVEEEQDYQHPFKKGVDQNIRESSKLFLDQDPQCSQGKHVGKIPRKNKNADRRSKGVSRGENQERLDVCTP